MAESQYAEAAKQPAPKPVEQARERPGGIPAALVQRNVAATFQGGRIDPRRLTPPSILALQRTVGNAAVNAYLQRVRDEQRPGLPASLQRWSLEDLTGDRWERESAVAPATADPGPNVQRWELTDLTSDFWIRQSKVGWFGDSRTGMDAIDTAVGKYAKVKLPALFESRIPVLEEIKEAIRAWYATKEGNGSRRPKVAELEGKVDAQLAQDRPRKVEHDAALVRGAAKHAVFHTMEPDLAGFAKRSQGDFKATDTRFQDVQAGGIIDALTMPRGAQGALTPEALAMMSAYESATLKQTAIDKSARGGVEAKGASPDQLEALMAGNVNALTNKTIYPELRNLTEPNAEADAVVTESIDMGGTSWQVTHNKSDVNLASKMGAIKSALAKIQDRGFTIPVLQLHIPKFGRKVTVSGDCQSSEVTERAMFVAPDFLHISSDVLGNPLLDQTAGGEYKFSSTGFDPSGVGTIVHEIGHALHYRGAPAKFHGLWGSMFIDVPTKQRAEAEVSEYGGKPREMVAEVFLGLVYGKAYSDEILTMYAAFGGPLPADLARFARK